MIDYTSSARLMENVSPGQDSPSWPRYPALDAGGKIQLLPGEEMLAVQSAKRIAQEGFAMPDIEDFAEMIHHLQERKLLISLGACTVYVTSLRTAEPALAAVRTGLHTTRRRSTADWPR